MSTESAQIEKKKKLFPKLRFKAFQESWNRILIQKLIDDGIIISHLDGNHGGLYPRSEEFASSGVPYITANDFINGEVSFDSCKFLPFERAKQFKKGIAKSGDVLFAHNATVGPTALLKTEFEYVILSTTATYFRCDNKNLLNLFLKYSFETKGFVEQYSRVMSQSTRNQVPITTQRKFTLALPEFLEQQKIATFLSAVDEKIQQLTRKKELLAEYKKGVMQQLFSGKLRFKDENGKPYPKWEEKRLGEIGKIRMCKRVFNNETSQNGDVPFYKIGTFGKEADAYITLDHYLSFKEKYPFPKVGEILISAAGTLGRTVIYDGRPAYFQDSNIVWIENDEKLVTNSFLYFVYQIVKYDSEGGTIQRLYNNIISSAKFSKPSIEEQQKIASFLTALDAKIEGVAAQIAHTQTFKKGLLQQMFV